MNLFDGIQNFSLEKNNQNQQLFENIHYVFDNVFVEKSIDKQKRLPILNAFDFLISRFSFEFFEEFTLRCVEHINQTIE